MTMPQRLAVIDWFRIRAQPGHMLDAARFQPHIHHGCCIGADEEFSLLARFLNYWLVAHVPEKRDWMSNLAFEISDFVMPEAAFLQRDRNIVSRCSEIIACPAGLSRNSSRGTWYTIEYAIQKGKNVTVIDPYGNTRQHQ